MGGRLCKIAPVVSVNIIDKVTDKFIIFSKKREQLFQHKIFRTIKTLLIFRKLIRFPFAI